MKPNHLNRADLINFARNVAAQIADGKVPGLLPEQALIVSMAIAEKAEWLSDAETRSVELIAASMEGVRIAQKERDETLELIQNVKYMMKGARCGKSEFQAVGLDPPVRVRQMVLPKTPKELSAAGSSNGVTVLKFAGRNPSNSVTYLVEAKIGDAKQYRIIGSTRSQWFKHNAKPGEFCQYRVRAQAARGLVSTWSNEAIVYRL